MRNKLLIFFYLVFFNTEVLAENININAKKISFDKNKKITIFENEVFFKTDTNDEIKADYAEYKKIDGFIKLEKNITAIDSQNNIIKTEYAEYIKEKKIFKSLGPTTVITSELYNIVGENIILDNFDNSIKSKSSAIITDQDGNKIYLDNFEYQANENILNQLDISKLKTR